MHRYRADEPEALGDRLSAPARRPSRLAGDFIELIDAWRRDHKWAARRMALEPFECGHSCSVRTIDWWLERPGAGSLATCSIGREEGREDPRPRRLADPRSRQRTGT